MMYAFLVTLFIAAVIQPGFTQGPPAPPEKECEDCADQIESCLDNMKPSIEEQEPFIVEGADPCKECRVSKLHTVKKDGEICVAKMEDGSNQQDMELGFDSLEAVCDCKIKKPDGSVVEGQMVAKWFQNCRVKTVLSIKDNKCAVVEGKVNCGEPKCQVPLSDIEITCKGSNEFKEECEKTKDNVMPPVFTNTAENVFPLVTTEKINENEEYVKQMSC